MEKTSTRFDAAALAAMSRIAARACSEAARLLADVGDPWFLVHTEAMLGAIAQADED